MASSQQLRRSNRLQTNSKVSKSSIMDPSDVNLLNWQPNQVKKSNTTAGKKPLPEPTTVSQMALIVLLHVCRRIVLFSPELKIGLYIAAVVCLSLVTDFLPFPRSYFSRKDNIFNQYFVKLGWGWTLTLLGSFVGLTSWTYCCGNKALIKAHALRLLIATVMWYFWTTLFVYIESKTGVCLKNSDKVLSRRACLQAGYRWHGFDISGHSFILIYCNLLIMEECKAFRGWERIGELIRNKDYDEESPLKGLSEEELFDLKFLYPRLTPYIKGLFVAVTMLLTLWDVMLVVTILYYHSMVQKLAGSLIAVIIWFVTYRIWYQTSFSPGLPGEGPFKYGDITPKSPVKPIQPLLKRQHTRN